jgi:hypothetical protein
MFRWPPNFEALQNAKQGESLSLDPDGTGFLHWIGEDFPSDITVLRVQNDLLTPEFTKADMRNGIYDHHNVRGALPLSPVVTDLIDQEEKSR